MFEQTYVALAVGGTFFAILLVGVAVSAASRNRRSIPERRPDGVTRPANLVNLATAGPTTRSEKPVPARS